MSDNGRVASPLRAAVVLCVLVFVLGWVAVATVRARGDANDSPAPASHSCASMPGVCGHGSLPTLAVDPGAGLVITNMGGERCPAGYLVAWILHQHSDGTLPFACVPPPYAFDANGARIDSDAKPSLVPNVADPVPGFASSPHVRPLTESAAADIGVGSGVATLVLSPSIYGVSDDYVHDVSVFSGGVEKARFTPQTATYNQDLVVHGNLVVHGKLTVDGKITQGERTTP